MLSAIWRNSCSLSSKTVRTWRSLLRIWRITSADTRAKIIIAAIKEIRSARATRGDWRLATSTATTRTAEATTSASEAIFHSRLGVLFGDVSERGLSTGSTVSTQRIFAGLTDMIRRQRMRPRAYDGVWAIWRKSTRIGAAHEVRTTSAPGSPLILLSHTPHRRSPGD